MKSLHGVGVALVTPFDSSGKIDFAGLRKVVDHTAKGVDYYVVMGSTGEAATLSADEKVSVLAKVIEFNKKKLPIVYGIAGNNTAAVVEEIRHSDLHFVDAILSASPAYNKPTQEGIFQHFIAIADASPVPVILYNVPGRTASNMTAETTLRLAKHKNIIGIKEASGNMEQCMKIAKDKPKDFMLISGDDMLALPLYAVGSVGVISVLANALPVEFRKMREFALQNDYQKAQKELFKLIDINGPMYEEANPVGVKQLMSQLGICKPHVRLPLLQASESLSKKIQSIYTATKKG